MTTQFKVGDIVRVRPDQLGKGATQAAQEKMDAFIQNDTHFEIYSVGGMAASGNYLCDIVSIYGGTKASYYHYRLELVNTIVGQPAGIPAMDQDSWRWGDEEAVTSASPRRMSDDERALIEQRIATKRKLRGDFS